MFGKRLNKDKEEKCGTGAQTKESKPAAPKAETHAERVLILGAGCPKCRALEQTVVKAMEELGSSEAVGHVTDYAEMAKFGVMSTPALVIDGKVLTAGRMLNPNEALKLLKENL